MVLRKVHTLEILFDSGSATNSPDTSAEVRISYQPRYLVERYVTAAFAKMLRRHNMVNLLRRD